MNIALSLWGYNCYFPALSATANINALSSIIKIDEIFFYESLQEKHLFYIEKVENIRKGANKKKKEILVLIV